MLRYRIKATRELLEGRAQAVNAMTYKGYAAAVEFDAEDHIFAGHLVGIHDIMTLHGVTADELESAFREWAADTRWGAL